jgi:hypothetical protein
LAYNFLTFPPYLADVHVQLQFVSLLLLGQLVLKVGFRLFTVPL